ncbi:hypothetical protein [Algoriphagus machipongonensis]|uniref:Monoheme Cytochrome c n=1 Tax=Algoriphagus machipongonensis TaxID=388413 RepID=A3HSJ4_9BACT|nr:hypothetical protein [Algoriphagus machipongonensis]EAZ82812.1 putative monoheme Cytochrome c [Algoriphagus machipongonensis]
MQNDINKPNKENQEISSYTIFKKRVLAIIALILVLSFGILLIFWIQSSPESRKQTNIREKTIPLADSLKVNSEMEGKELDPETQLVLGEGFELVKGNCTNCHSSALVIQNRFTREGWKAKIEWMQETQGLWPLGEGEDLILDYLAEHYAPEAFVGRRAPLKDVEWYQLDSED